MNKRLAVAGVMVALAASAGGCGRATHGATPAGAPVVSVSGPAQPAAATTTPTTITTPRPVTSAPTEAGPPTAALQQAQDLTNRLGNDLSSTSSDLSSANSAIANGG